jgi:hypothetical protein
MATTTDPRPRYDHDANQRRVRHPLQILRKYIRAYVALEGAALVLLFLAGWFWIGMALDYGSFKLFAFDWVQELRDVSADPERVVWVRLLVLGTLLAIALGLVLTKVVLRCLREFSDDNLALVLERRFPRELGDRLITAVEVADPALARRYGFSQPMVEKTVSEAIERLEKLPVAEAFNWARLRRLWLLVAAVTIGTLIVVGALTVGVRSATGNPASPAAFAWDFQDVAAQWGERNLLLRNAYWPRRAYLEVLRFKRTQDNPAEMRMGQKHPGLQVRAVRWLIADPAAHDGWRPLRWSDLPGLLGEELPGKVNIPADWPHWFVDLDDLDPSVPADVLPASWLGKSIGEARAELKEPMLSAKVAEAGAQAAVEALLDWKRWSVDKIEIQKEKLRQALRDLAAYTPLEDVYERLTELADTGGRGRRLRLLPVPDSVEVTYRGAKTKGRDTRQRLEDNKYAIGLNDLKESARFRVRGEDYYTASRRITLVPPPSLAELAVDKEEPAYLYHRLQGDDQTPLRGKVQEVKNYAVSTTGEMSSIDVPLGGALALRARADRKLRAPVLIKAPQRDDASKLVDAGYPALLDADGRGFTVAFGKIDRPLDLTFEFADDDNIAGQRRIVVQPALDQPPEIIDADLDAVLRKPRFKADAGRSSAGGPAEGFLITPDALLPFKGILTDDHGLARAGWLHEVRQVDIELIGGAGGKDKLPLLILHGNTAPRRAGLVASGLVFWPGHPAAGLVAPSYLAWMGRFLQFDLAQSAGQREVFVPLEEFRRTQEAKALRDIPLTALAAKLTDKAPPRLVAWSHPLKDEAGFDVKRELPKLKSADPGKEGQLHYLLRVSAVATDNNIDSGAPVADDKGQTMSWGNSTRSKSFFFLIVSENELLAQIALEEEVLYERLEKVMERIKAGITTTEDQLRKLGGSDVDLSLVAIRMNDVRGKAVLDAASTTREVTNDYNRILREMEVNRVGTGRINKVRDKICFPLDDLVNPAQGSFARCEDTVQKACQALDDDVAANRRAERKAHQQNLRESQKQLEKLRDELNAVLIAMSEGIAESKLLEILIAAERTQRRNTETLRAMYNDEAQRLIEDLFKDVPKK